MPTIWKKRLLALFLLLLAAGTGVYLWRAGLFHLLSDRERLVEYLRQAGIAGPLLCIGIQFIQVVIFVIPGEITQFASGYVFGAWWGFIYSIAGIMLGSTFNFYVARLVGRPALETIISPNTLERVDQALETSRGKSALFLLFLLPGAPKDVMSFGAGLARMSLIEFIVISGLGRSPALLASVLLGSQAYRRDYRAMIITALVAGLAVAACYLYERRRKRERRS